MKKTVFIISVLMLSLTSFCGSNGGGDNKDSSVIEKKKIPLTGMSSLDQLVALASDKKVVLLGEATHGTREFYAWRDSISRRLISEKGFSFILVEGDWASLFMLNRYVKGLSDFGSAHEVVRQFNRWPLWMWRNEEVVALAEWLKEFNTGLEQGAKVGFYGMDVYDEWSSYDEVMDFLVTYDTTLAGQIREYYHCMEIFDRDSWQYAGAISRGYNTCAPFLKNAFDLLEGSLDDDQLLTDYDKLYVLQNARVFKNAEKFFRKAVNDQAASWNSRAMHMFITLQTMLEFHGSESKGIVWAHNTHIGDARATDMALSGQVNIGQLTREQFGADQVLAAGFGAYSGRVTAGRQWGGRMEQMLLPDAMEGSFEEKLKNATSGDYLLIIDSEIKEHNYFSDKIGHRAVGVVYNPETERFGNYVPSIPGERYDAFLFFEKTSPLRFVD